MKYQTVTSKDGGGMQSATFPISGDRIEIGDFVSAMEIRGWVLTGFHKNKLTRRELQGQPQFKDLNGPMWDGDHIRYEDMASYLTLSS